MSTPQYIQTNKQMSAPQYSDSSKYYMHKTIKSMSMMGSWKKKSFDGFSVMAKKLPLLSLVRPIRKRRAGKQKFT